MSTTTKDRQSQSLTEGRSSMFGSRNKIPVFTQDSFPYGISFSEWTARWWQWALSIPIECNPVKHMSSHNYATKQAGPVWFLAGTDGGFAERKCTIPAGRSILLPILNHGGTLADTPNAKSEIDLLGFTNEEMDIVSELDVVVDNMKLQGLENYRVKSPIFDVVLPENNLFDGVPGPTKGASDGYWLFLKPLNKGKHRIQSFGSCRSGRIRIGVDYQILVI